ncbi:hypothetical protein ACKKBG_A26670 [Auxenochlorella protothecoides x Auxenochlorella symbiontica]
MSEARRRSRSPAVENGKEDGRPLLELDDDNDPRGIKRKQPVQGRSFKVIGHMVLAMQRFKASLNPTYTYGKRPSISSPGQSQGTESGEAGVAGLPHSRSIGSERGSEPAPEQYVYAGRGHKADYLFKSLPKPDPPLKVQDSSGG